MVKKHQFEQTAIALTCKAQAAFRHAINEKLALEFRAAKEHALAEIDRGATELEVIVRVNEFLFARFTETCGAEQTPFVDTSGALPVKDKRGPGTTLGPNEAANHGSTV